MTIFLAAHTDRSGCGAARPRFLNVWMPNIGTQMFGNSLDSSLLCAPNCREFVYVTLTPKILVHIPLLIVRDYLASKPPSTNFAATTIFQINKDTLKSTCLATSSNRMTTTRLIFPWVSRWHGFWPHCQIFRCQIWCRFHLQGCI